MKIKNISLLGAIAAIIFTASCTKKEQIGPEIKSATKDFKFVQELTVTKAEFKSLTDRPDFEVKFNEEVSWKLRLIGLIPEGDKLVPSGAEQIFTGLSDGFDGTNLEWDARSNNIQFFRFNQKVATELTITGIREKVYGETFTLRYVIPYHNVVYNGIKHIIVDGFENVLTAANPTGCLDILGKGKSTDAADTDIDFDRVGVRAVNGYFCYKMTGRDINRNSWSGDIYSDHTFNFYRNITDTINLVQSLLIDSGINPNDLYFNIFIYGQGSSSAGVQVKVFELDSKPGGRTEHIKTRRDIMRFAKAGSPDPINRYLQSQNDGYIYNVVVNWQGWRLVSIPYSDFRPNIDPGAGGNGDRKKESWRICGASLSLLSEPPGNLNEVYLDLFTVTQKGKFQF
jgi:hypothetical protein